MNENKMVLHSLPRIVIAGLSGDAGKTLISTGLVAGLRSHFNMKVAPFKKGPDYIDAAWLSVAAKRPCHNLDTFLMTEETVKHTFVKNALLANISVIEGNRGLFDGFDVKGSHSTAHLASILKAPVLLIISVRKVTRTALAMVLGCQQLAGNLPFLGVVLNRCGTSRQRKLITRAIEEESGIPVVGALPTISTEKVLPDRHLGLVTPSEHENMQSAVHLCEKIVHDHLDIERIVKLIHQHARFDIEEQKNELMHTPETEKQTRKGVRIGFFKDSAFTFYYPENLEALEQHGAELVPISSLDDQHLPHIHGLYIGGGFPETHAEILAGNRALMSEIKRAGESGLPIYAECGGLIYLSRNLVYHGNSYDMTGLFPVTVTMNTKPQGHGYAKASINSENPFFPVGSELRGHEFHYSSISSGEDQINTAFHLSKGTGAFNGKCGLIKQNTLATYIHIHALGTPLWAENFVASAKKYRTD